MVKLPITNILSFAAEPGSHGIAEDMPRRVLIVDDNKEAADSLVKLLNMLGSHAEAVYSGADALAHMDLSSFDVIILDIGMPHMDGYEVIRALRERGIAVIQGAAAIVRPFNEPYIFLRREALIGMEEG